ncbi:hypothetical protein GALMADRAFT_437594 [Galerina marginata CBS 339.88]|uniref:Uncharacterized protein n=1 Tax=Galerina marginata (strain CBS 339.88) TaxID=685588 RepID=A0A067TE40_GALM3|nr:hypothetical protein GALMADRAFT_437594 [Galerina marginata CBS 339.88]
MNMDSLGPESSILLSLDDDKGVELDGRDDIIRDSKALQVASNSSELYKGIMVSAQSQVLEDPNLLELIFLSFGIHTTGFVSGIASGRQIPAPDSQHLLWASLACKNFFNPAMDVLWKVMDSWLPLLQLLPTLKKSQNLYVSLFYC